MVRVALIIAMCSLVVVVISSGNYATVHIPSGPTSTLESYLCDRSKLSSGTSLQLQSGEHVISGGPSCSITNLQDITITGTGRDLTVVRCIDSGRGFNFWFVKNLIIAEITFVGCGQDTTINLPYRVTTGGSNVLNIPLAFCFQLSSISIQHVTIKNFSGLGIYGFEMDQAVLNDVQFFNCTACSGAVFCGVKTLTVQGCLFANMTYHNSNNIGSGLSVYESDAVITDSVFYNQSSEIGAIIVLMSRATITSNTFVLSNGGALKAFHSYIKIANSTFSRNFANTYGGAICVENNYFILIYDCVFTDNVAGDRGGAISSLESCRDQEHDIVSIPENLTMYIKNCVFANNGATVGGAIYIFNSCHLSKMVIIQTTLQKNSAHNGAAIYAGNYRQADSSETYFLQLSDLLVLENGCSSCLAEQDVGAAVCYREVSKVYISGGQFVGNSPQGAIQGFAGNLYVSGNVLFKNNMGESGGAINLLNNGQLYFNEGSNVVFDGNTATTYGGAIYIQGDPSVPKNVNFLYILCAIHFIGQKENYSITFSGNNAFVAGQSIYAAPIYHCSLTFPEEMQYKNSSFYFMYPSAYYSRVFNFSPNSSALQILSLPVRTILCSCNDTTQGEMLSSALCNISTTPGRTVRITATSVDSDNNTSPAVVYTNVPTNSRNVSLAPQQNVQWIGKSCDTLQYQIYGQENTVITLQLSTFNGIPITLQITLQPCDPGFVLVTNSEGYLMCNCSSFLISYMVNCDVANGTVTRHDNQWIGVYNNATHNHLALAYTCPIDYCRLRHYKLSLVTPGELCDKNRHGLLCGHCRTNLSVLFGSTQCQVCSDLWLLTILLYGTLGIVLVAVLFALNITVTQGTIYGLIFYANVVQVNSSIYFNQPLLKPFQILISFINLDLGFPLCFYNGMDDAAKTGLQFVFPVYLLALTIIVIMACRFWLSQSTGPNVSNHYLNRFSHFVGKRAVSVLATLIYLSYSKLLRTVIDILTYATVIVDDGTQFRVWFYDGTIRYLEGRHLPLFCLAIATSVFFILPYSFTLTLIPIVGRFSDHNRLFNWLHQKANLFKPMNDAYFASYKGVWRSWLGVRLWLLVILYIPTPVYSSDRPYLLMYIHGVIMVIFMFIQACAKPFEEPLKVRNKIFTDIYNWIDSIYFLNYAILALTMSYILSNGSDSHYIAITVGFLVGLSGIMISASLISPIFMAIKNMCMAQISTLGQVTEYTPMQGEMNESFEAVLHQIPVTSYSVKNFRDPLDLMESS